MRKPAKNVEGRSPDISCTRIGSWNSCGSLGYASQQLMASAVCAVTVRPHVPSALPAATRKLLFRCRAASTMSEASPSLPDAEEKKTTTVFVAGSTGRTGKLVVEKLLAKGFGVVAGTTDVGRARDSLPQDPNLQLVSFKLVCFLSLPSLNWWLVV